MHDIMLLTPTILTHGIMYSSKASTNSKICYNHALQAYQLFKARASGADAVLLIAAVLPNKDLQYLMRAARKIKLQILLEVGV